MFGQHNFFMKVSIYWKKVIFLILRFLGGLAGAGGLEGWGAGGGGCGAWGVGVGAWAWVSACVSHMTNVHYEVNVFKA